MPVRTEEGCFDLVATVDANRVRIAISGELDITTAPRFINTVCDLTRDAPRSIAVDCAGIEFLDSAGVRALIVARHEASKAGAHFAVVDASPPVLRVLDMTGLTPMLT